jgi:hypothetical protein
LSEIPLYTFRIIYNYQIGVTNMIHITGNIEMLSNLVNAYSKETDKYELEAIGLLSSKVRITQRGV